MIDLRVQCIDYFQFLWLTPNIFLTSPHGIRPLLQRGKPSLLQTFQMERIYEFYPMFSNNLNRNQRYSY